MDKFSKQPYEEFAISADFSKNLLPEESITGQVVFAMDKVGLDVSSTITNQASVSNDSGGKVTVLIRAGTEDSSPYKITFRCVTTLAHKWEHDVQMIVREI